jgi:hypothetical protein
MIRALLNCLRCWLGKHEWELSRVRIMSDASLLYVYRCKHCTLAKASGTRPDPSTL